MIWQAFKRNGEAYKLIWPGKAEFVRMAARFGATIVPFAAIGADESISQILDGAQVQQLTKQLGPLLGRPADDSRQARIPRARVGVNATMEDIEAFSLVSRNTLVGVGAVQWFMVSSQVSEWW
jgi:hypothetical protein